MSNLVSFGGLWCLALKLSQLLKNQINVILDTKPVILLFMSAYNALSYQVGKIWHYYYEGDQSWEAAGNLLCFCEVQKKKKVDELGQSWAEEMVMFV